MRRNDTTARPPMRTASKIASLIGIVLVAIGLLKIAGGFPPQSWILLAHVLPNLVVLWRVKGAGMLPPFLLLVLIAFSLLAAWLLLLVLFIALLKGMLFPAPRREEGGGGGGVALSARDWQLEDHDETTHPIVGLRPFHIDDEVFEQEYQRRTAVNQPAVLGQVQVATPTKNRMTDALEESEGRERPILGARERHYARFAEPETQPLGLLSTEDDRPEKATKSAQENRYWWQQEGQTGVKDMSRNRVYQPESEAGPQFSATNTIMAGQDEELDLPFITEPVEDEVIPGHLARFFLEQDGIDVMGARRQEPANGGGQERVTFAFDIGLDVGIVHKGALNEDSVFATTGVRVSSSDPRPAGLFIVADGLGGHVQGREASHLAVSTASDAILPVLFHETPGNGKGEDDLLRELIQEGVHRANFALYQRNCEESISMGTTFTAAMTVDKKAYVVNVGDSRTYLYREGEGLRQLTRDHSLVMRMVEVGALAREDIYVHPLRNQVYRSLGNTAEVAVDVMTIDVRIDDFLLLCSDGLWEMVRDSEIESIMRRRMSPSQLSSRLVQAALRNGGADNIGVVVVKVVRAEV